jgi:hypothetical protein
MNEEEMEHLDTNDEITVWELMDQGAPGSTYEYAEGVIFVKLDDGYWYLDGNPTRTGYTPLDLTKGFAVGER